MKTFDLQYLGEKERAKPAATAPKKVGFGARARLGHFGDLRLLGLSAGIALLCILCVLIMPGELSEPETVVNIEEAVAYTPPALAGAADERDFAESTFDEPAYYDLEEMEASDTVARGRTPEERERLMREMARNIPEGQTLIW